MFSKKLRLIALFNVSFLVVFLVITFCVGLSPTINKFGLFQPAIIIFSVASVLTASLMLLMSAKPSGKYVRLYPFAAVLLFLVAFAVQLLIARALISTGYTWDTQQIYDHAARFATTGTIGSDFIPYLRANPNNIGLITGLSEYLRFMHDHGVHNLLASAVLLNVAFLFAAQVLTFLVAYMLYGKRIALISVIFSFVFISLSLYVQTPYTDTLTIAFPIGIYFLGLLFVRSRRLAARILLAVLIGLVTTIGYLLKPTVVIALVAIGISAVFWLVSNRKTISLKKTLLPTTYYLAALAVTALAVLFVFAKAVDASHILPYKYAEASQDAKPPLHFIAMGMRTIIVGNSVAYGGYNAPLSDAITNIPTKQAKNNFAKDAIREQLADYGPLGYLSFLGHKIKWILSDATFFAYGEGDNDHVRFLYHDRFSTDIRQAMYVKGRFYLNFGNVLQVFWVCLLLLITMQLFFVAMSTSARFNIYTSTLRLMVAGILVFLLFFEGRSRYVLLYLPIFIILALYTLRWFKEPDQAVAISVKP